MCKAIEAGCINITKIEIVGHSLGAQLAAAAAVELILCKNKLKRITGLDPAGPGFQVLAPFLICGPNLNAGLAELVIIIHSDGGNYGTPLKLGTVDISLNCGCRNQPGCKDLTTVLFQNEFSMYFSFIHLPSDTSCGLRSWKVEACDNFHTSIAQKASVKYY